jgi:protein-S-isoprenylcysteine O-methyltransferase Ste14
MTIKGMDQLRKHVPDLNTPLGVLRLILLPVILLFLVTVFFNYIKITLPVWQLGVEILLGGLGFGLLYLFFRSRQDFRNRFGPLAYNRAARRYGLSGVTIISIMIAHIHDIPGPKIPYIGGYIVLPALGWVLIGMGVLLGLRTVHIFGVDNLTMLYVYFPEESRLVNHKIYNVLRHPAYAALQLIAFGLGLLDGSWVAILSALIFILFLWGWVRLVEEKELIKRFGPSYLEYRKRVPAFWPRLTGLSGFFGFLFLGK